MDNEENTINDFFDSRIVSCKETHNLVEVGRILYTNNTRHVIVKNDFEQILGEISAEDLSFPKLLQRRNFGERKIMQAKSITNDLWCVTKDCPMYYVIKHFVYKNTKYVCIVNNQKEKKIVGEYELDSLLKYLWEWINKEIYNKKHENWNEINELLNERLTDIDANMRDTSAIEHILKKVKTCKGEMSIMKIGRLMNFDNSGYVGVNGNAEVNGNGNLSGFVNFDKMNIFGILFEAKKQNILMHHLKAKDIINNKIFVGDENLKTAKGIDLLVKKGVEVFLTNEKISYKRLCKEGIVKFLGKIYLYSVVEPSSYGKYKNIFKISSNVNIHKKATSQSVTKNRDRINSKKRTPKFAEDIMTVNPTTCGNTETLVEIGNIMTENNFNHIIITNEKNIPVSVVSAEDITTYKMIMGEGLEGIENTKIYDIMNNKIWCANIQTPFINLVHKMATDRVGSLPVINNYGKLLGIVTKTDIFEGIKQLIENSKEIREKIGSIKVSEIMNKDISLCFEDDFAIKKDKEMSKYRIKYLLVIDRNTKKIAGIVSLNDFILSRMRKENKYRSMSSVKIKEVMNKDIATVDENHSITEVINTMAEKHLSVIPVLGKDAVKGQIEWWSVFEKLVQILYPFYVKK